MNLKTTILPLALFLIGLAPGLAGDGPIYRSGRKTPTPTPCAEPLFTSKQRKKEIRRDLMKVSGAVDQMAADIEEFGTMSISSPLLTLPSHDLWFNLKVSSDDFYQHARTEVAGRAFAATAIAQSLGVDVQASADVDQLAAARAIRRQIAPQTDRLEQLQDIRQQRADLAYDAVMRTLPPNSAPAVVADTKQKALKAKQDVLNEQIDTTLPAQPKSGTDTTATVTSAAPQFTSKSETVTDPGTPQTGADGKPIPGTSTQKTTTTTEATATPSATAPRVDPDLIAAATIAASHTALGPAGAAFTGGTIAIPDLDAVKAAESASSLQGLMNFFRYPADSMQFRDKTVMMGAVTVSVAPGWRTAKDWAAEVVMVNKYKYTPARPEVITRLLLDKTLPLYLRWRLCLDYRLPWPTDGGDAPPEYGPNPTSSSLERTNAGTANQIALPKKSITPDAGDITIPPAVKYDEKWLLYKVPQVSGISPLSESDTLDLASEFRRQDQFALALAATLRAQGAQGSAKVFEQWVKTQQKDVQTRSVSTAVASFSRGGGVAGFQIGPRLKALADPASRKNKSGFVLERQAFPALLVYGLDGGDLYPRIKYEHGRLLAYEPKIEMTQNSYWHPLTHRFQGPMDWFGPFKMFWPPGWWEPALDQQRLADRSLRMNDAFWDAYENYRAVPCKTQRDEDARTEMLAWQDRGMELKSRYFQTITDQFVPADVLVPVIPFDTPKLPLPGAGAPPASTPFVTGVMPKTITTLISPNGTDGKPTGEVPVQEIAIFGHGLNHVREIQYLGPDGTLILHSGAPADVALKTEVGESSIHLFVRVKKSTAGSFRLALDADASAVSPGGGPSEIFTPSFTFVVDGKAPANAAAYQSSGVEGLAGVLEPGDMKRGRSLPAVAIRESLDAPAARQVDWIPVLPEELRSLTH